MVHIALSVPSLACRIAAKPVSARRRNDAVFPSVHHPSFFNTNKGNRRGGPTLSGPRAVARGQDAAETDVEQPSSSAPPTPAFHLAFPVRDIPEAREFYGGTLGLQEGRSSDRWVDFSLYGHQIVCHQVDGYSAMGAQNAVDGDPVPVPHFGLAMTQEQFHELAGRIRAAGIPFVIEPHLRFEGMPGEQWTMFFKDPSGNALEFKAMSTPENLFAKYHVE